MEGRLFIVHNPQLYRLFLAKKSSFCSMTSSDMLDVGVWKLDPSRFFPCKSFFNFVIDDHSLNFETSHIIWKVCVPTKIQVLNEFDMLHKGRLSACLSPS